MRYVILGGVICIAMSSSPGIGNYHQHHPRGLSHLEHASVCPDLSKNACIRGLVHNQVNLLQQALRGCVIPGSAVPESAIQQIMQLQMYMPGVGRERMNA